MEMFNELFAAIVGFFYDIAVISTTVTVVSLLYIIWRYVIAPRFNSIDVWGLSSLDALVLRIFTWSIGPTALTWIMYVGVATALAPMA